jgi:hypothetical protein
MGRSRQTLARVPASFFKEAFDIRVSEQGPGDENKIHGSVQIGAGRGGGAGCSSLYRSRIGSSVSLGQNFGEPISFKH